MNGEAFLSLLQFSDGLFPAGSYAHSFGLETYAADGTIRDAEGVERFLLSYLEGSVAPTDAVAALASRKAAVLSKRAASVEECAVIDHRLDAMKSASELRDASRQMGRQVLRIAAHLGGPFAAQGLTADLLARLRMGKHRGITRWLSAWSEPHLDGLKPKWLVLIFIPAALDWLLLRCDYCHSGS